jgi:endonuclease V-like protein UPF0215 family
MNIETATKKDLPMLRKMEEAAKLQISRSMMNSQLPDADVQIELLKVRMKIEELETQTGYDQTQKR